MCAALLTVNSSAAQIGLQKLDEDDDDDQTKISTYSTAVVAAGMVTAALPLPARSHQ